LRTISRWQEIVLPIADGLVSSIQFNDYIFHITKNSDKRCCPRIMKNWSTKGLEDIIVQFLIGHRLQLLVGYRLQLLVGYRLHYRILKPNMADLATAAAFL